MVYVSKSKRIAEINKPRYVYVDSKDLEKLKDFYINLTDIIIFMACFKPISILRLSAEVGIAYKNLKLHLTKLEKWKFITITGKGRGYKKYVKLNVENKSVYAFFMLLDLPAILEKQKINNKQEKLEKEFIKESKEV